MSTPRSRARWVRAALVGACSAVVTTGAHAGAGGGPPQGAALIVALLLCATVGAVIGSIRSAGPLITICALGIAQLLGHLTLVAAGGHHHGGGLALTSAMVTAHIAAAVALGIAISAVEYLYVACSSVLCWLRLFAMAASRPVSRSLRGVATDLVVQTVLRCSGLGMRAPPRRLAATA